MGCQTNIARKIREKQADYVFAVKENQPTLCESIRDHFAWLKREHPCDEPVAYWDSGLEQGHGRIERREITAAFQIEWLNDDHAWPDAKAILEYRCTRIVNDVTSQSTRYYLTSLETTEERYGHVVRSHWSIENQLHWMLDVAFGEDASRARKDNSPVNLNILRKLAMACLKKTPPAYKRLSLLKKMRKASRNPDFLLLALFAS
jgi:predicted transposase YbfD/YdcC